MCQGSFCFEGQRREWLSKKLAGEYVVFLRLTEGMRDSSGVMKVWGREFCKALRRFVMAVEVGYLG